MRRLMLLAIVVAMSACGSDNNVAGTNNENNANNTNNGSNNTSVDNNANNTSNSTNNANNTNNGSNNTTANNTTGTNNDPNNVTCMPLDPAIGDCDPLCQSGCEVGEHCLVGMDAMASCGPSGPRGQNERCSADTECALGFHCRSVGGAMQRTCLAYCNPDGRPGCPSETACVRLQADTRVGACVPVVNECEAVPTDSCADPDECYDTIQGRKCLPAGTAALDEDCGSSSDCAAGLRCVSIMDVGQVCKPLCDPSGGDDQCTEGMCQTLANPDGQPLSWGACF